MDAAILHFFASIRCPALDAVFGLFSALAEAKVLAALAMCVYWLAAERAGEQIAVSLLTSLPVGTFIKVAAARPRPYAAGVVSRVKIDNAFLSTEGLGDNRSFPSGHAQLSAGICTSCAMHVRHALFWVFAVIFPTLVACSRLYLGVHYPTDVLAGGLLGAATSLVWALVYSRAPALRYYFLGTVAVFAVAALPFIDDSSYVQAAGLVAGAACFMPLSRLLPKTPPSPFPKRLLRVPIGALTSGMVYAFSLLCPPWALLLRWFLFAGGATFLAEALFRALKI